MRNCPDETTNQITYPEFLKHSCHGARLVIPTDKWTADESGEIRTLFQ
ncbi:hypothetical protein GCM10007924_30850 [Sneathiella chinensis]|uniref:Uncharacterized protein n=1 Tax=Sneathiella chinensis TaxID=349750 RepID=A0ABQ5U9K4_9PROT|nr:hypothetical protein GCM10007924_30850 [Sneathiella chinensis]